MSELLFLDALFISADAGKAGYAHLLLKLKSHCAVGSQPHCVAC